MVESRETVLNQLEEGMSPDILKFIVIQNIF